MSGAALSFALFLSGAAGLIFQVVWLYRAGLALGSSVSAVTVVLSAFMGGLAIGNALAATLGRQAPRRALVLYAVLEHVVAAAGVGAALMMPGVASVVAVATDASLPATQLHVVRFLLAFVLMAVPASAMGATLPIVVGALATVRRRYATVLGTLYGWNTSGALIGVLLADVILVPRFGVTGTAYVAAGGNLLAGWIALALSRRREAHDRPVPTSVETAPPAVPVVLRSLPAGRRLLLVAAALAGAILLALEVVWFRFLSLFVLSTTFAATLMMAAVLAGIALGGFVAAVWLRRPRPLSRALPAVASLAAVTVAAAYAAFGVITTGTQVGEWHHILWMSMALSAPTATLSGALFTMFGAALNQSDDDEVRTTAALTFANTAGALVGPPLAAFVLLPQTGTERSLLILSLSYLAVAVCAVAGVAPSTWRRSLVLPGIAGIVTLAVFPYGAMLTAYLPRSAQPYAVDGSTIARVAEGPAETMLLMEQRWHGAPIYQRLVTNGFSMTGTGIPGQRYMRAFAYLPMLLHREPIRTALLICYGVGVTAGAVLQIPSLTTLDVAEISPEVAAMSASVVHAGDDPLTDPRSRLHLEDGRFFLTTTRLRFDLITGEPPPPRTPGAVNIYSEEFFSLIYDRLNPGGVVSYWLPVARPQPGTDVDTIIPAFCAVFRDCSLWNATPFDFMLIGSRDAPGPLDAVAFASPWQVPGLQSALRDVGFERPEQIGATFLGDADYLAGLTRSTPPLTDDFPQRLRPSARASLSDPRYGSRNDVRERYQAVLDPTRAREAFATSPFIARYWPDDLRRRSLDWFAVQRVINTALWDGGRPLAHIEDLHALLTTTTLRTLPVWMLGSDDVKLRAAENDDDRSGTMEMAKGMRSLSARDYEGAALFFQRARSRDLNVDSLEPLLAYAQYMRGQYGEAKTMVAAAVPGSDDERHFWGWLANRLADGDAGAGK